MGNLHESCGFNWRERSLSLSSSRLTSRAKLAQEYNQLQHLIQRSFCKDQGDQNQSIHQSTQTSLSSSSLSMRVMTEEEDSDRFSQSWLSDEAERSDTSAKEDEYGREVVSTESGSVFEEDEVGMDILEDTEEDGKRNFLRRLLALPPELLPEICSHLSPRDLLRWGRSCKLFRSIFFSKTTVSQTSWKLARRHVALPDLKWPTDEPEYASLVYDTHCMGDDCARSPQSCCFGLRKRLCYRCTNETFIRLQCNDETERELRDHRERCISIDSIDMSNPWEGDTYRTYFKKDTRYVYPLLDGLTHEEVVSHVQTEIRARETDMVNLKQWQRDWHASRCDRATDEVRRFRLQMLSAEPSHVLRCLFPSLSYFEYYYDLPQKLLEEDWEREVTLPGNWWLMREEEIKDQNWRYQDNLFQQLQSKIWALLSGLSGGHSAIVESCDLPFLERIRKLLESGKSHWDLSWDFLSALSKFFSLQNRWTLRSGYFPEFFAVEDFDILGLDWTIDDLRFELCLVLVSASPLARQEIITEEKLNRLGFSFECLLCDVESKERMDWLSIIDHILEFHSWCKLSDSIQFCSTSCSSDDDDDDDDDTSEGSASTKSSEDEDDSED